MKSGSLIDYMDYSCPLNMNNLLELLCKQEIDLWCCAFTYLSVFVVSTKLTFIYYRMIFFSPIIGVEFINTLYSKKGKHWQDVRQRK